MSEGGADCARMMGGADENYELAFVADLGAAVESAEREAGAGAIGLGAQFEFARSEQFTKVTEQLRAGEVGQVAVGRDMLLDVPLDDTSQFLEQRLLRKRGDVHVVGREDSFEVGELGEDPSAE